MHKYTLMHTYARHTHKDTQWAMFSPVVKAGRKPYKPAPGDYDEDSVFHRQLQLEFSFVGPSRVVLTEGKQRAFLYIFSTKL